jgi:release factor glutamine methyltransferase
MTIREAFLSGRETLASGGIESANLDSSLLLAEVVGVSRSSLIGAGPEQVSDERLNAFLKLLQRRLGGECVAYILGRKEFRGLDFAVNPSVLVPRPETETLVEAALEKLKETANSPGSFSGSQALRVLDLCTGSGAVAIALKNEMPELELWATDISPQALETAKSNAVRLLPEAPIHFRLGDLYGALDSEKGQTFFSLILSNAPYIPSNEIAELPPEVKNEPHIALDGGADGLCIIKRIVQGAKNFLQTGGSLFLESDPRQMEKISSLLEKANFCDLRIHKDLSGWERVISANEQRAISNEQLTMFW